MRVLCGPVRAVGHAGDLPVANVADSGVDPEEPEVDPWLQERDLQPHQLLAAAVLRQAVLDATGRGWGGSPRRARGARLFLLRAGPELRFWCEVAGLSPQLVRAYAARKRETA